MVNLTPVARALVHILDPSEERFTESLCQPPFFSPSAHRVRVHPQPRPRTKLDTPLPVPALSEQHSLARGPPHAVLLARREPERDRRRAGRLFVRGG